MTTEIGAVWNILFTLKEEEEIIHFLKENDFSPDKDGLKEYILESITEPEETQSPKDKLAEFLRDNPEVTTAAGNLFGIGIKMLRKKVGI